MNLWKKYSAAVQRNCAGNGDELDGLPYWRNKLFAAIMVYLLPLSLIGIIPGVIMSLVAGIPALAAFDIAIGFIVVFIALCPGIPITLRKAFFICLFYITSLVLLYFLGSFGPGLLYLLATTVFVILISPAKMAYWSVAINTLICAAIGGAIELNWISHALVPDYSLGSWIAVSSNVILLSAVMVILIPMLFNGLQKTIEEQERLRKQLKKDQQTLEQSLELVKYKNSELEQFAYIASHDLQEPLRSMSGLVGLMKKRYEHSEGDREIMGHILVASDRMRALVTGLLEYARIGMEKKMASADCNELVKEVLESLDILISETQTKIVLAPLPVLQAYPTELKQLFQNLITNAIKFHKEGTEPRIEIGIDPRSPVPLFYLRDNGIGIAPAYREKIFVIFKRLHTRSEYEGTGIGLAYCRKIAELHGGKIWVESEEGKGATFYFTIPQKLPDYESEN